MKKLLIVFSGLLCLIALFFSVLRIIHVNDKYKTPSVITYNQGEELTGKNLKFQVTESRLMDKEEFESEYCEFDENDENRELLNKEMKVLIVDFKIDNIGQNISEFVFFDFVAQSGAWANGWSLEMYRKLNDYNSNSIEIAPGESKELKLVFCMYDIQFKNSSWNNIENRKFYIVVDCYPVKSRICLTL